MVLEQPVPSLDGCAGVVWGSNSCLIINCLGLYWYSSVARTDMTKLPISSILSSTSGIHTAYPTYWWSKWRTHTTSTLSCHSNCLCVYPDSSSTEMIINLYHCVCVFMSWPVLLWYLYLFVRQYCCIHSLSYTTCNKNVYRLPSLQSVYNLWCTAL